jgi:plasmid stabilization system protein ParE
MSKLIWRQAAIDDLDHIFDFIAQDNPSRAASFTDELVSKARFLAENPNLGETKIPNLPSVRIFPHGNYLLLFLSLENLQGIELLRIIHGARDYANYLLDDF